jgi:hypothetical protein
MGARTSQPTASLTTAYLQTEVKNQSIISIVGFRNFFCCLVWAVDLGVRITDEGRSLYIGSFCPAMTPLSRYLEELLLYRKNHQKLNDERPTVKKTQLLSGTTEEK